jgi:hypothetical protein
MEFLFIILHPYTTVQSYIQIQLLIISMQRMVRYN